MSTYSLINKPEPSCTALHNSTELTLYKKLPKTFPNNNNMFTITNIFEGIASLAVSVCASAMWAPAGLYSSIMDIISFLNGESFFYACVFFLGVVLYLHAGAILNHTKLVLQKTCRPPRISTRLPPSRSTYVHLRSLVVAFAIRCNTCV